MDHCLGRVMSLHYSRIRVGVTRSGLQSSVQVSVELFFVSAFFSKQPPTKIMQGKFRTSVFGKHNEFNILWNDAKKIKS